MADIYLETDIDDSLRALVDYDSDGQSLTARAEDKDDKEELEEWEIIFVDFQLVSLLIVESWLLNSKF